MIYLDYNATTPIAPEVAAAMRPYLEQYFGNPSSTHLFGIQTKKAIENARQQVAALLHCATHEIIFTSGGTEANNMAIKGFCFVNRHRGNHIITSQIEHPAVLEVCHYLEQNGFTVSYLSVNEEGMLSITEVEKAITAQTILISIMHANNEVGTIQPLSEIGQLAKKFDIKFHSDAAQSVGKIEVDVQRLGVDMLSVAGHKLYAPKGVGVLFLRDGIRLEKLMHGANHEQNLRAGTENVLEIVGLGAAAELARISLNDNILHLKKCKNLLLHGISQFCESNSIEYKVNGHAIECLPNTLSICFKNVEANLLLAEMSDVAASAGAACHSDKVLVSSVLQAMKVPIDFAMGTIRLSTGKNTTENEVEQAVTSICNSVLKLTEPKESIVSENENVRLTQFTHGLGCACKIRPQDLEKVLSQFQIPLNNSILVSNTTSDDAAVYKISADIALVQTLDFLTPIVDNPFDFGAIAAANALSDIYAMGATPLFALSIVAFPTKRLPISVLREIIEGANFIAKCAGISILGGHSIEDNEPKYGLCVTGTVHPDKILRNSTAQIGDCLILTKPIGTGVYSTAMKRGFVDSESAKLAVETMKKLNKDAAEVITTYPVSACTDVTGFGLLGHLKEIVQSSQITTLLNNEKIPVLSGAKELVASGIVSGGTLNNLDFVSGCVEWGENISENTKLILADAQTSGGLLFSISENFETEIINALNNKGIQAFCIGNIIEKSEGKIIVK